MAKKTEVTWIVNVKKDVYDVYVGRPSQWGNPFTRRDEGKNFLHKFERYLRYRPALIHEAKMKLSGKRLGCFCAPAGGISPDAPLICHAQILARAARGDFDIEE